MASLLRFVLLSYIDYDGLNGRYGEVLMTLKTTHLPSEQELFDISDGFTYLNRSIYLLAQSFVFIKKTEYKKAESSLSLISPLVLKERNFHLWFKLFYDIAKYGISQSNETLLNYISVSKKLQFSLLDVDFCKNYFSSK